MMYEFPIPVNLDPETHNAGYVHAYLQERGLTVYGVSINDSTITVETTDDPANNPIAYFENFTPEPTERELLLSQLNAINLGTATTAKLREAVSILKELVT